MNWFGDRYGLYLDLRSKVRDQLEPHEIDNLIAAAKSKSKRRGKTIVSLAIVLILITAIILVRSIPSNIADSVALCALITVFIVALIDAVTERTRTERIFAQLLRQKGIRPSHCFGCGYDLQESVSKSCPECGEPLAPPKAEQS